jgi:tellurite resistance protein TerA
MEIRLEKSGEARSISLEKAPKDEIVINLNWNRETKNGAEPVDLDLGCYWETRVPPSEPGFMGWLKGLVTLPRRGVIDGMQFTRGQGGPKDVASRQGCYTQEPWVWHAGDDRVGTSASGENLLLNAAAAAHMKRLVVYTFIYEGAAAWSATDAVVRIAVPGQPPVVIEMGKQTSAQRFCALATIEFDGASGMTVTRHMTFHDGHAECALQYRWQMNFTAGTK